MRSHSELPEPFYVYRTFNNEKRVTVKYSTSRSRNNSCVASRGNATRQSHFRYPASEKDRPDECSCARGAFTYLPARRLNFVQATAIYSYFRWGSCSKRDYNWVTWLGFYQRNRVHHVLHLLCIYRTSLTNNWVHTRVKRAVKKNSLKAAINVIRLVWKMKRNLYSLRRDAFENFCTYQYPLRLHDDVKERIIRLA